MTRRARFAVLLLPFLLLGLLLPLPGCITDPVTGKKTVGIPMSDKEEISMGNQYAPSFKAQYEGAYPDPDLQRHCEAIVLGMARASHRPDLPWNFTILNSSEVNAFALPGGTVCITRGLLWRLDTEAMFAGVMGHEIGHVSHKHAAQGMGRSTIFNVLLTGAAVGVSQTDSEWAQLGLALGAAGGQIVLLSYSRGQESESDSRGIEYSYEAGYDPRELSKVFVIFKKLKGGDSGPAWLSTHPLDDDRIAAIQEEVQRDYPQVARQDLRTSTPTWDRHLAKLRQDQKVYDDYDAAGKAYGEAMKKGDTAALPDILRRIESCRDRLPAHALFTSGMGVVLHAMGQTAKAKGYFEKAAAQQADLFEPRLYLTRIAFDARDDAGVHRWGQQAERLFPAHPTASWLRASTYDRAGDLANAGKKYEEVAALAPDSDMGTAAKKRVEEIRARGITW